jgi:hypothetical protein
MSQTQPLTGADFFVSSSLAWLSVTGEDSFRSWTSTPVSIGIRQPLLRPNVAGWDRREQPIRYEVSERQFREAKEDIALRIVALFFDVHEAKVRLASATSNVAVNDTLYRLNQGASTWAGSARTICSRVSWRCSGPGPRDGARPDHQRRSPRFGWDSTSPRVAARHRGPAGAPDIQADTLRAVQEALRNRAIVTDAELQELQADRRVNEAKLNNGFGATIVASFGLNATGDEVSLAYQNLQEARRFEMAVQIPLVQWGARKEGVQAAQYDKERIASSAEVTRESTAHERISRGAAAGPGQAGPGPVRDGGHRGRQALRGGVQPVRHRRIGIDNLHCPERKDREDAVRPGAQAVLAGVLSAAAAYLFDFEAGRAIQ